MTKLDAWLHKAGYRYRPRKAPLNHDEPKEPSQVRETSAPLDERKRQARNEKRRAKYAHRATRRTLGVEPVYCAECGEGLWFKRKDAKFCSDRCRQAAHREKAVANGPKSRYAKTKKPLRTNEKAVTKTLKVRVMTASRETKTLKVRVTTTPPQTVMAPYYVPKNVPPRKG